VVAFSRTSNQQDAISSKQTHLCLRVDFHRVGVGFEINFNNPMVIEWNTNPNGGYDDTSWKSVLYKLFKAKGKKLSLKLKAAGYDGIVTVRHGPGGWETSECVDLTVVH
jgi:hypothetical protein